MELDGLLLDEEVTFSLSGFQDFTVSVLQGTPAGVPCPACAQPLASARPWGVRSLVLRRAPCGRAVEGLPRPFAPRGSIEVNSPVWGVLWAFFIFPLSARSSCPGTSS